MSACSHLRRTLLPCGVEPQASCGRRLEDPIGYQSTCADERYAAAHENDTAAAKLTDRTCEGRCDGCCRLLIPRGAELVEKGDAFSAYIARGATRRGLGSGERECEARLRALSSGAIRLAPRAGGLWERRRAHAPFCLLCTLKAIGETRSSRPLA